MSIKCLLKLKCGKRFPSDHIAGRSRNSWSNENFFSYLVALFLLQTALQCGASRQRALTVTTIFCATSTPLHRNLSLLASCNEAIQGHLPSTDNVPLTMNPVTCLLTPQELVSTELTTDNEQLKENTNKTPSSIVDADCSEGGYRIDEANKSFVKIRQYQ